MVTVSEAEDAVKKLLEYIEGSAEREGLIDTPNRVISSWQEIFSGYHDSAAEILDSTFNGEGYDGIVLLKDIEFHSTCEHHLQRSRAVLMLDISQLIGLLESANWPGS